MRRCIRKTGHEIHTGEFLRPIDREKAAEAVRCPASGDEMQCRNMQPAAAPENVPQRPRCLLLHLAYEAERMERGGANLRELRHRFASSWSSADHREQSG